MRKIFYISCLCILAFSCDSQKKIANAAKSSLDPNKTNSEKEKKGEIVHIGTEDFYKVNIADSTKNNNTISYGSIVSAKPKKYKITKTYFPSLGQGFRQRFIILHYTALDNEKSIRVLTQQSVSSHYLVSDLDDHEIYQLVDENKRAYHAGISAWKNSNNLNDNSIGIEIVNTGYAVDSLGKRQFQAFPEHQIEKIAVLVKDISKRYMIPPTNILAHSDIAPTRKQDPGPLFPWKTLYEKHQIGMWYDEDKKQEFYPSALEDTATLYEDASFIRKIQSTFKSFGYDIQITGMWDKQTKSVIEAFQYHFRPENYDGILDAETWSILQALAQKYK